MAKQSYRTVTFYASSKGDRYYTVKVNMETGRLSCDCPCWIFNHRGDRTCKHTDRAYDEHDVDQILLGRVPSPVLP